MANPTAKTGGEVMDFQGLAIKASQFLDANGAVISTTRGSAIVHLTDSTGGATGNNTLAAMVTQTALTDNAAGVAADGTIAAISDLSTAGGNTYTDAAVNAKLQLVRDAVKELSTTVNLHTTAINTGRDNLADLAAKVNAILAALETAGIIST
jgi:hypothetical protein